MFHTLLRFVRSKSGNFGMITALLAVPLIGAAGLAVDFSNALSLRSQLYEAANAAALGAISESSSGVAAAMAMSGDGVVTIGQDEARKLFFGQLASDWKNVPVNVDISVTKTANVVTSNITFHATVPTSFLQILGDSSIPIAGSASAQYQTASFIDFYMLLDNTPSMGVGATSTDIAKMQANTSDKCAFACHNMDTTNNYYNLAKKLGVSMRIDVVRQATQKLTETATTSRSTPDQYRMAVYTFGTQAESAQLTTVSGLSSDMTQVKSYTDAVDLMTIPYQGYNNDQTTSFDNALTQMKTNMGTGGGGTSSTDREKVLFFVTDGVGDSKKPYTCTKPLTGTRCQEPIDTSFCQPLKDQNVKIAILYTTYLPLPANNWYNTWIAPFQSQIPTRLQSCASPGLYFEVNPTQGITDAMNALFLKIIRSPRLTS
ncbi:pilus assembly protein TadG-related protein (plasmid) [Rhizobium sp. CB3090]|uniref:pilus assembly protein n=1 Tax=Rhizobium sp. CB3090 TaxID=3039156 RepID=UPI0024B0AAB9|nr:pilus assembly protein TadG-related protein [Rhizobium sp. CB3090]WFU11742.1 pilus assembly protein TadG-related protein [Rhizobium sp. CB3090]